MKKYRVVFVWALLACTASAAWAAPDQVRKNDGTPPVTGKITEISPLKIVVESPRGTAEIPVNQVAQVILDGEPGALKTAKTAILAGRYEDGLATMEKVDLAEDARKEVVQEAHYYKALATAKLALVGEGTIADAGRLMIGFFNENPKSYHYFEGAEVIGDLLVANRNYGPAATYYTKLAEAPWPEYKMRANVAIGKALLAENKPAEAQKAFEAALAITGEGEAAERLRATANLGKFRCTAESSKPEEVIKIAEDVIAKTDPEQTAVMAGAYNILGAALKKAGRTKEALMAFLHVDVLYYSDADAHAEALANLAELWNTLQQTERAVRARRTLDERYPTSPFARR
jgi:tetratricopeptide (TPR) repeat protein